MKKLHYSKFNDHRQNARKRGINFCFSYNEWVDWWETQLGPKWHLMRGKRMHQFVMARNGDNGAYELANVHCITNAQNKIEQHRNNRCGFKLGHQLSYNGPRTTKQRIHENGIKITPEQVELIFRDQRTQRAIAAEFGVSERLVRLIKTKKVWQRILSPPV